MAKARMTPAKRKKIIITRNEARGDIHISGGVAKIRLTLKVIFLFFTMVAAAIAVVYFAARQSQNNPSLLQQLPAPAQMNSESTVTTPTSTAGPVISFLEIVPSAPTATSTLELKYDVLGPAGQSVNVTFSWYVNGSPIQEGESNQLQPGIYAKGSSVYTEVIARDEQGNTSTRTSNPVTIINSPPVLSLVTLEMSGATVGSVIKATNTLSDPDNDTLTCTYQWLVNNAPSGPPTTQNTFSTSGLSKQDAVSVTVVCSDGEASTVPVTTSSATFENSGPEITSTAPDSIVSGVYTYQVAARDPDGDKLEFRLERGPAGMTIDQSTGLIHWTVPKGAIYTGRHEIPVKFTVTDGNGGTASQEFVIVLVDYVAY